MTPLHLRILRVASTTLLLAGQALAVDCDLSSAEQAPFGAFEALGAQPVGPLAYAPPGEEPRMHTPEATRSGVAGWLGGASSAFDGSGDALLSPDLALLERGRTRVTWDARTETDPCKRKSDEASKAELGLRLTSKLTSSWSLHARAGHQLDVDDETSKSERSSWQLGLSGRVLGADLSMEREQKSEGRTSTRLALAHKRGAADLNARWTLDEQPGQRSTTAQVQGRFRHSPHLRSRVSVSSRHAGTGRTDRANLSLEHRFGAGSVVVSGEGRWKSSLDLDRKLGLELRSRKLGSWVVRAGAFRKIDLRSLREASEVFVMPTLAHKDLELKIACRLRESGRQTAQRFLAESSLGWQPSDDEAVVRRLELKVAFDDRPTAGDPGARAELSFLLHVGD